MLTSSPTPTPTLTCFSQASASCELAPSEKMSVQEPANGVLRTIWTTAMDRYFIDLMLEQVGKGSRVDGHLFSKRAWRHMTLLFNDKFKLQYTRDHLKNRHKTLRRIYRAVNNLLEQYGFNWDETQHMVTADDHAWSNYTKAHPEARSYRTKSIPHYSDMCKIFKNAPSGRHDNSSQTKNHKNGVQGTNIGMVGGLELSTIYVPHEDPMDEMDRLTSNLDMSELEEQQLSVPTNTLVSPSEGIVDILDGMVTVDTTTSENGKQEDSHLSTENVIHPLEVMAEALDDSIGGRSRTYWQAPMDSYFIELMLDQVHEGNQFDGTFRKHSWLHMTELFNAKFGYKYDTVVLKNRYKTLKRQYTAIKVLVAQKGFVWDDSRQMVKADDHVWHDYVKVHPDAKQYITRAVPYFRDMSVIFKDASVDEGQSDPSYSLDKPNEDESERELSFQQAMLSPADDGIVQEESPSDYIVEGKKKKRQFPGKLTCQNPKKLPRRKDEAITEEHQCMDCQCPNEGVANVVREIAAVISSLLDKRTDRDSSIQDVIHALQSTPDIDDDLILDACDLFEDENKAKTFLSLDVRLRTKWLIRKLRP